MAKPIHICGNRYYFSGENIIQKVNHYIQDYEIRTLSRFIKIYSKGFAKPERCQLKRKPFWSSSCKELPIDFDGVPFVILGRQIQECFNGPDRHRARKKKDKDRKQQEDHDYHMKSRNWIQTSKKMDCPAAIHLRSVVRFPTYLVNKNSGRAKRRIAKQLRADIADDGKEVPWEHRVYMALPSVDSHQHHLVDDMGCMTHDVHANVISKIHLLVADGVRDVGEMKRHISAFSKTNYPTVPLTSNRYYPNSKCLRNHMHAALSMSQLSTEDQENLRQHVEKWKVEMPDDRFHFVPRSFLAVRFNSGIEAEMDPHGWEVETVPHSRQKDSISCGMYVLKFAELYLRGDADISTMTISADMPKERKRIQLLLLSLGIKEQEILAHAVSLRAADASSNTDTAAATDASSNTDTATAASSNTDNATAASVTVTSVWQKKEDHEAPRKRKRKDQRKSSIFAYTMPKKSNRLHCVCQKKDDCRIYWRCELCHVWLHPSCMGLDENDEPDKYICFGCQLLRLPEAVLKMIFKEVVLSDGDTAYGRLSQVCTAFRGVINERFYEDCHLAWLLSIKPQSYWDRAENRDLCRPFKVMACKSCGYVYKEEGPGYCGGNGRRGQYTAFYSEKESTGFCSLFCCRHSDFPI